ncbi:hypothetical protein [uncultured Tenacibaculum sp.]|uniref:hypothetical protein n=1 Tax=uncultured Tenacibaculum sp. TaxID=174713 RepID=UPI0026135EE5|nr:hypothetical protein [uncultured Tenacibaculum sp.]
MKETLEEVRKAPRATHNIVILFVISIIVLTACKSSYERIYERANSSITSTYTIKKFKSKSGLFTGVHFNTHDSLGNIDALIQINKVNLEGKTFSLSKGTHNIKIAFIGKKTVEIKRLKVNVNDSIVIKTFLKNANLID